MHPEFTQTLQKFIDIPSVSGQEEEFAVALMQFLSQNFPSDVSELQKVRNHRYNVVLKKGEPKVFFTSHLDTVPTSVSTEVSTDKIQGLGACDAKGQIVAQLYGMKDAISKGLRDFGCFYVVGEEVDSCGAHAAMDFPDLRGAYVLNGEPTGNKFVSRSKGVIEAHISAVGESRHSSLVPLNSAIHKLIRDLHQTIRFSDSRYSVNVGTIEGGLASNVSAPEALAKACVRIDAPSAEIIPLLQAHLTETNLNILGATEPFDFFVPEKYRDQSIRVGFCSDSPYYADNFKNVMMFGPGAIERAHTTTEFVTIQEMEEAINILSSLLLHL
jgi:acetylornithine deacetylase/succinyl-diaminopimelate desuccinylase-like protein